MSDIQRYSISGCGDTNCDPLIIDSDGPYVEYSDVKVIISERDQLKAENEALRKDLVDWQGVVAAVKREVPERFTSHARGNAPGHGHSISGVWDDDNGALAGKECAWCKAWNAAMSKETAQ
jgi:hypothetical protein